MFEEFMDKAPLEVNYDDINNFRLTLVKRQLLRFKMYDQLYEIEQYPFYMENLSQHLIMSHVVLREYNKSINEYKEIKAVKTQRKLEDMIFDISKQNRYFRNLTYTNIDKRALIVNLTNTGLFCGTFTKICEKYQKDQSDLDKRIKELEEEIFELKCNKDKMEKDRLGTTGRGSKTYNLAFKGKISDRNIGQGYKQGDFIENYNARIGDTSKQYGGTLTDLRELPFGTFFHCMNGNWYGTISCNSHADKTVEVSSVTGDVDEREIKIDESNCVLYIEILD